MEATNNDTWLTLKTTGDFFFKQSKFKDALHAYDEAFALNPRSRTIFIEKANCHTELGNPDQALYETDKAKLSTGIQSAKQMDHDFLRTGESVHKRFGFTQPANDSRRMIFAHIETFGPEYDKGTEGDDEGEGGEESTWMKYGWKKFRRIGPIGQNFAPKSRFLGRNAEGENPGDLTYKCRYLLSKADALYNKGDFEAALVYYHKGRKLRPKSEEFRLGVQKSEKALESFFPLNTGRRLKPLSDSDGDKKKQHPIKGSKLSNKEKDATAKTESNEGDTNKRGSNPKSNTQESSTSQQNETPEQNAELLLFKEYIGKLPGRLYATLHRSTRPSSSASII